MLRTIVRLVVFILAVGASLLEVRAQVGDRNDFRAVGQENPARDFDIRQSQMPTKSRGPAGVLEAQDNALVEQRKRAAELFLATPAPGAGQKLRILLNEHGLPKAYFREGAALSAPSQREPEEIAKDFLLGHSSIFPFASAEVDNLRLAAKAVSGGATFLTFNQTWNGIDVFHGMVKVALNAAGEVVHAGVGEVIPQLNLAVNRKLSEEEAVQAAFRSVDLDKPGELEALPPREDGKTAFRNPRGERFSAITVELSVFPMTPTSARLAYRIFLEADREGWYEMLIDAENGRLLFRHNLYVSAAQGRVWTESPLKGTRQLVNFPTGWLGPAATVTKGNNVDAYLDVDGNDTPDTTAVAGIQNGRASSMSQVFDFPFGDGTTMQDPRGFQPGAVTNLFYFVNTAHDYYYSLGFNEVSGNFQTSNLGRGGVGNDAVLAEAQFGGFTNNASFARTPEGTAPKMRIGIFTRGTSANTDDLDADYDGEVVIHEYGHGVSNRLVGGLTNVSCLGGPQSRAMGEGWSDYFASSFFNNPVLGAYATQNAVSGFRRHSYEGYPFTYEDIGNQGYEVHRDGEIWAATLWDLRKVLSQATTDQLVINALRLTPCNPSMIDGRDAILAADQAANGGANRTAIWQGFARHGMGFSASGVDSNPAGSTVYNAAYDLPLDLEPGNGNPAITSQPMTIPGMGDLYLYAISASDPDSDPLHFELTEGPAGMTIDPVTGLIQWTTSFVGQRVKVTVTDGHGGKVIHGFSIFVVTLLTPEVPLTIDGTQGTFGNAVVFVPPNTPLLQVTMRNGTGDPDLLLFFNDGSSFSASARVGPTETLSRGNPLPGFWVIEAAGFKAYSGVSLKASFPIPTFVPGNATMSNLSGGISSETFYRVAVPAGAASLKLTTAGGTGDVDVFLKQGQAPNCQVIRSSATQKRGTGSGCGPLFSVGFDSNNESITVNTPPAGDWYINLSAPANYSGVSLTTALTAPSTLVLSSSSMVFSGLAGGAAPTSQTLTISNAAKTMYNWTAAAVSNAAPMMYSRTAGTAVLLGGGWLALSQTSGSGDTQLTASVNPAGLGPGTYQGTITVTAAGLAGSPQVVQVTLTVGTVPVLAVGSASLNFSAIPGQNPQAQSLAISNAGGGVLNWTVLVSTTSGGAWLDVDMTMGSGNATLQVSVLSSALAPGTYGGAITITALGAGNSPTVVAVSLTVAQPVVLASAVSAASFVPNRPITEGQILSLFGDKFTDPCSLDPSSSTPCPTATAFPLPVQLGDTQVTFNGTPAPLILVTATQINLVAPYGLTGPTVTIVVIRGSVSSAPLTVQLAQQVIGVFSVLSNGAGAGVVLHLDGTVVRRAAPVQTKEIVIAYGTGFGGVSPSVGTGLPAPSSPPAQTTIPMRVFFDGTEGTILFSGLAPGFAGLNQMNIQAPSFLGRRYTILHIQSAVSVSNEVSLGGPGILDITPGAAGVGNDVTVTVRGINFASGMALQVGGQNVPATFADGALQTLTATIPGSLLGSAGTVAVVVVDPGAPREAPSNAVELTVQ
ncbi:MAG: M36 family metallopeptidase [Acidobacteria bacterium]|nr:M36 family metallopeptidase [Acidobacteriota bacterium]